MNCPTINGGRSCTGAILRGKCTACGYSPTFEVKAIDVRFVGEHSKLNRNTHPSDWVIRTQFDTVRWRRVNVFRMGSARTWFVVIGEKRFKLPVPPTKMQIGTRLEPW